jgi:hypothetical protein
VSGLQEGVIRAWGSRRHRGGHSCRGGAYYDGLSLGGRCGEVESRGLS